MSDTKVHVNWTIDQEVYDAIKRRAISLTDQDNRKWSESAVANALLIERLRELTPTTASAKKYSPAPVHYEDIDNE